MRDLRHQEEEEEEEEEEEDQKDDEEMEEVGKHAKVSIVVKSPSVTPRPGRKVIAGSSINHSGSSNRFLFLCC